MITADNTFHNLGTNKTEKPIMPIKDTDTAVSREAVSILQKRTREVLTPNLFDSSSPLAMAL